MMTGMGDILRRAEFLGTAGQGVRAGGFMLRHWRGKGSLEPRPHGHAEAHFMYVPPAADYFTEARGLPAANRAHLVYNPPGTYHRDRLNGPGRFFSITVPGAQVEAAEDGPLAMAPTLIGAPAAHNLIARIIEACSCTRTTLQVDALCYELVAMLTRPITHHSPPAWLAHALEMIRDTSRDELSVASLARSFDVHPVHLARMFRAFVGATPSEVLRAERLSRAARLLSTTRRPLSEIAQACGFTDQSHMNRLFQRAFAVPPGRYRTATLRATTR
jgi:AraC family transcriptional regulator